MLWMPNLKTPKIFPYNFFEEFYSFSLYILATGVHFIEMWVSCVCVLAAHSHLTLCNLMNCSPPGSPVPEILQARILEWFAVSFSRGSSRPRDQICVSCISGGCFTVWATRSNFILLHIDTQLIQYYLLKRLFLPCWMISSCQIRVGHRC